MSPTGLVVIYMDNIYIRNYFMLNVTVSVSGIAGVTSYVLKLTYKPEKNFLLENLAFSSLLRLLLKQMNGLFDGGSKLE